MEIKPFKFIVRGVLIELEDGEPVGEQMTEEAVVYGKKGMLDWLDELEANIPTEPPTE